jgi:hypothetical protein
LTTAPATVCTTSVELIINLKIAKALGTAEPFRSSASPINPLLG